MSRPEVRPSNSVEVYRFYKDYLPRPSYARFLSSGLRVGFAPDVSYAEDAAEMIRETLGRGRTIILAANHIRAVDPCVLAAAVAKTRPMRSLIGNTFIPAKAPIFKNPVVRRLVDGLGALPVFRPEDAARYDDGSGKDTAGPRRAAKLLLETCISRLNKGQHMGIFPEGTRNKTDSRTLQVLQGGVGAMVCRVSEVEQPAIIPVGISYSQDAKIGRHAAVYFGRPSVEPFARSAEVVRWLQPAMQASVDGAVLMAGEAGH